MRPHCAYALTVPRGTRIPLVCDSPHSGTAYPADFCPALPLAALRQGEDTHVEALWSGAPAIGAILLAAKFPRTYIDPNRALEDIDPDIIDGPWPGTLAPGAKSRIGHGLLWREMRPGMPLYDRKLTVAEVRRRIDRYYAPYHRVLAHAIDRTFARFGCVWHLNLHSMPDNAYELLRIQRPHPLADFVLGDRDGTTCEPAFVDLVAQKLRSLGYTVACNDPYKGVELIAQIGQPALHRHSMQIEIRRPLYMDEATRERNADFAVLQRDLQSLLQAIARHVHDNGRPCTRHPVFDAHP